ncbi:MAG: 30S ribosomal protein S12 methylthiotransferase RimO [Myxococcota bacterium]|nr:30S ribosomal protein S12 methylthiotransferase RimO [Myxococcota bacterium]
MTERVHLISLGCPKNRVDSEVMVGKLRSGPYELVDDPDSADVIVVNTCSFIQSATEESIDTILGMSRFKDQGTCKKLIVTGCMVQRYGQSLEGELPEVDFFLGTGEYHRISEVLSKKKMAVRSFIDTPMYIHDEFAPRLPSWKPHSAYLKISEGCNHRCAFCIIPTLRGKLRSRTVASLVSEAKKLAAQGVVELNLVSQDSTSYGRDLKDGSDLGMLLRALTLVDGIRWIRLHYAYPIGLPDSLLSAIADEEKICRYIDIPLQHASGPVLKRMRRGVTRSGQERILSRIRNAIPDVTVRTTFIVGFPGETDQDFQELCDFVSDQSFDRVGVFTYSQEDGTAGATMDGQVEDHVKKERQAHLMELQREISKKRLSRHIGQEMDVLVDGPSEEFPLVKVARTATQAPDVDGVVYLDKAPEDVQAGMFTRVRILQTSNYDMVGEVV